MKLKTVDEHAYLLFFVDGSANITSISIAGTRAIAAGLMMCHLCRTDTRSAIAGTDDKRRHIDVAPTPRIQRHSLMLQVF